MLRSKVNYSIISKKSDFIKNVVSKHIIKLNTNDGVFLNPSLFGSYIVIGDKELPKPNKFVISYIKRDLFEVIDLDEDPLPVLFEMFNIETRAAKDFIRNIKGVKLNSLYFYITLLKDCEVEGESFNFTKANLIVNQYKYEASHSQLDKFKAVNNYVSNPTEDTLFTLIKVFSDERDSKKRLRNIAYIIRIYLDDEIPDYIVNKISFSYDNQALKQYLILASEIALMENFDTFLSNLIGKLR